MNQALDRSEHGPAGNGLSRQGSARQGSGPALNPGTFRHSPARPRGAWRGLAMHCTERQGCDSGALYPRTFTACPCADGHCKAMRSGAFRGCEWRDPSRHVRPWTAYIHGTFRALHGAEGRGSAGSGPAGLGEERARRRFVPAETYGWAWPGSDGLSEARRGKESGPTAAHLSEFYDRIERT